MNLKLCESDFRFMCVIWDNEPIASGELVKQCLKKFGWKKSTTYTMLKKMCEKGFAENADSVVRALISREIIESYASDYFVEQTFQGSLPGFLVAFFDGKKISAKEAEKLKRLIDEFKADS